MNVWVIAIEAIKIIKIRGVVRFRKYADELIRIIAIRLMCIPGINPVIVPAKTPKRIARIK